MITINLTAEQIRILTNPTRIEEWGAQQEVARNIQAQVMALTGDTVTLDAFDIAWINKANEVNHIGRFIDSASTRAGGWPVHEFEQRVDRLQCAAGGLRDALSE